MFKMKNSLLFVLTSTILITYAVKYCKKRISNFLIYYSILKLKLHYVPQNLRLKCTTHKNYAKVLQCESKRVNQTSIAINAEILTIQKFNTMFV